MEAEVVSFALFFVIILLFMVVHDSSPTMQKCTFKLINRIRKKGELAASPVVEVAAVPGEEVVRGTDDIEKIDTPSDGLPQNESESPPAAVEQAVQAVVAESEPGKVPQRLKIKAITGRVLAMVSHEKGGVEDQEEMFMTAVTALRNTVDELAGRVAQVEAGVAKTEQFDEQLAEAKEETQMVSEEMQDILGSIRVSIDALDGRLNAMNSEMQELKDREPEVVETEPEENENEEIAEAAIDEETRSKIKRLEEFIADINETLESLPQDVQKALEDSKDANERLEVISDNFQATLGYGIKKSFRCESCGTHGTVASQVACTKCGTSSWWGWWPENEDNTGEEGNSTEGSDEAVASDEAEIGDGEEVVDVQVTEVLEALEDDEDLETQGIDELGIFESIETDDIETTVNNLETGFSEILETEITETDELDIPELIETDDIAESAGIFDEIDSIESDDDQVLVEEDII